MRSPVPLLAFALGLLPSFTIAKCGDNVAIERLPVFSDSDGPFIIRAQEGFNVFLQYEKEYKDYNFVLSKKDSDLPEFELKDGNLTSADGNLAGIYGKVPQIYPPPLLGLYLIDHVGDYPGAEVVFVTKTRSDGSGREVRRLFFLDGREFDDIQSFPLRNHKIRS